MGFYRARNITHKGLMLEHGPIVFPEGCDLAVEFFDRFGEPRFCLKAKVLDKDQRGMGLKFDFTAGHPGGSAPRALATGKLRFVRRPHIVK